MNFLRTSAGKIADSWLLSKGKRLWAENQKDWNLKLTKVEKLLTGLYIISKDYSTGRFPPTFPDQQKAYEAEIEARNVIGGMSPEAVKDANLRKPFWFGPYLRIYFECFLDISESLERLKIAPPAKILEIGCGGGWTSEFLAQLGFDVVGTTISPFETAECLQRVESMRAKDLRPKLDFRTTPMENVHEVTKDLGRFDAVVVFEALHHAYDWRKACEAAYHSLKPGGWFLLCNEPNLLHTFISYRKARMANTHEIGFNKGELFGYLRSIGFSRQVVLRNRIGLFFRPFWVAVQRQ